jgi:hypothetical protein
LAQLSAQNGVIDDAAVLREVLATEDSTARTMLTRLGMDQNQVRQALCPDEHTPTPRD